MNKRWILAPSNRLPKWAIQQDRQLSVTDQAELCQDTTGYYRIETNSFFSSRCRTQIFFS